MDPLSIVASTVGILTFVGQVIASIDELKLLCREVKDLPADVDHLLNQIQWIAHVIQTMLLGDTKKQTSEDAAVQLTLRYCQSAGHRVDTLTRELTHLMRRNTSKLEIALSRGIIKTAIRKLDQSKVDLQTAFTLYDIAHRRDEARFSAAEQRMTIRHAIKEAFADHAPFMQQRRTLPFQDDQDGTCDCRKSRGDCAASACCGGCNKSMRRTIYSTSIKLPLWLCEAAWKFSVQHAVGSWSAHLDRIDIIPKDHKAFRLCRKGDVAQLTTMLERGMVTVHSQDPDGKSLFRVALSHFQTDTAKFLLARGARIESPRRREYFDSTGFLNGGSRQADATAREVYTQRTLRCMRFVAEECMLEDIFLEPRAISATDYASSPEVSSWNLQHAVTKRDDLGPYMLNCATHLVHPRAIAMLDQEFFSLRTNGTCSLSFVHLMGMIWYMGPVPGQAAWTFLTITMLADAIRVGADMQALNDLGRTPFLTMVEQAIGLGIGWEWDGTRILDVVVKAWANLLANCGVDLESYAAFEHERFRKMHRREEEEWWREDGMIGFSSGPEPKDWHVWPRHFGDVYCGVFWNLIEPPVRASTMPCTYPRDDIFAYLHECDENVINAKPRTSGLKARTIRRALPRNIRRLARQTKKAPEHERREAMERACDNLPFGAEYRKKAKLECCKDKRYPELPYEMAKQSMEQEHRQTMKPYITALINAEAWRTEKLMSDEDDRHLDLLDEISDAGLSRPGRVGLRASLWSLPSF